MAAIDRSHQELIMEDGSRLPYDHLVLCTGQQFQVCCAVVKAFYRFRSQKLPRFCDAVRTISKQREIFNFCLQKPNASKIKYSKSSWLPNEKQREYHVCSAQSRLTRFATFHWHKIASAHRP